MTVHVDRSLRLPESEYFADPQAKSGIALHHTVCDSARTTLDIWRRDKDADGKPKRIATAFVIDRDGTAAARPSREGRLLRHRGRRHPVNRPDEGVRPATNHSVSQLTMHV